MVSVILKKMYAQSGSKEIIDEPWLVWVSGLASSCVPKRLPDGFLGRTNAWVAGSIPDRRCVGDS